MFFRRGVSDDDPWLDVKLWLFSIGALLALLGMLLERDVLIGAAGVVLATGVVLRFVRRPTTEGGEGPEEDHEEER